MNWVTATVLLHGACAVLYLLLPALILVKSRSSRTGRLSRTGVLLAGACLVTALWAGSVTMVVYMPGSSIPGLLDLLRSAVWCGFIVHLYVRAVQGAQQRRQAFVMMGLVAGLVMAVMVLLARGSPGGAMSLWSSVVVARLGLAVCAVLLLENLYLNTPGDAKWHVNLPCVALGALSVYDIALSADALLFRQISPALFDGRAIATAIVAPLLVIAAVRNRRRWEVDIHVSRSVVFHSATLVVSGIFLLGLVLAGEAFRYIGADWGGVAEISLIFAGLVTIAVLLTSRSARSRLRNLVVDHFFSHRYDYRREWMRCIATLSAPDSYVALHNRVIRAVAEIVDSPGGVLFLRERGDEAFQWAGSWNMPAAALPVMAEHPLVAAFRDGEWIVEVAALLGAQAAGPGGGEGDILGDPWLSGAWLAVPLNHGGRLTGFILTAPSRAPFKLDLEVFDLLRIVGRQVATYVAEQRATEVLMQTRQLHEYGKRFAFVAHDIKNVSSQLSLLLSNAEVHMENPEFQRDMLATIRASVAKIGALIKRLTVPENELVQTVIVPAERLEAIAANSRRVRGAAIELEDDGRGMGVAMGAAAFDAVVTHLLDNAVEATRQQVAEQAAERADRDGAGQAPRGPSGEPPGESPEAAAVRVVLRHEARRAVIDIIDCGTGMSPEFVRDELFRPFRTSKPGGSGIGAYQARELLREAGGDLVAMSRPGAGTTMRLLLPLVESAAEAALPV